MAPLFTVRLGASQRRRQLGPQIRLLILSPAVAQTQQVGIAALCNAVVSPEGTGTVVDATHQGNLRGDCCFQLDAQVIEQLAVVLPERLFIKADLRVVADALQHAEAQPRLKPQAGPDAHNPFSEGLRRQIGIGCALVVFPTALLLGDVAEEIRLQLQGQWASAPDPSLQANAQYGLRTHLSVEQKGVAEGGIDHLAAPGGHRPRLWMPIGDCRQQWWAHQRFSVRGDNACPAF